MIILRHRPVVAVFALLTALMAAGCTATKGDTKALPATVSIGLLTPMTGPQAEIGREANQGAQLAIEVVNNVYPDLPLPLAAAPGLGNGVKLTLSIQDTQGASEQVEAAAERLADSGTLGLVLADNNAVAGAVGRRADQIGIAVVDANSTADSLATLNRSGQFRIQPSDQADIDAVFNLISRSGSNGPPVQRYAIATGSPGDQVNDAVRVIGNDAAAGNLDRVGTAPPAPAMPSLAPGAPSMATQASTLVELKADIVFAMINTAAEANNAADLANRLAGKIPVVAFGSATDLLETAKPTTSSILRASGWSADYARRHPIARVLGQMYEQKFSMKLTAVAAAAFSATLALAMAINVSPAYDVNSVRTAVAHLSIPATQTIMPWDGIRFDGNGTNQLGAAVIEQRQASGFQVIYPTELAAVKLKWPG